MSFGKTDLSSLLRTDAECLRLIHSTHFPNDVWTRDAAVHADRAAALLESRDQRITLAEELLREVMETGATYKSVQLPRELWERVQLWLSQAPLESQK